MNTQLVVSRRWQLLSSKGLMIKYRELLAKRAHIERDDRIVIYKNLIIVETLAAYATCGMFGNSRNLRTKKKKRIHRVLDDILC